MPYTEEQIVELAAIKVQEVVIEKVQAFTEGVEKEVQKLRLQYAEAAQFNSAIQRAVNKFDVELAMLGPIQKQVIELHTLFCKNGYMQRFNQLAARMDEFFRTRFQTCPVAKEVGEISTYLDAQKVEAVERAEGKLRTREQDAKDKARARRWRITALISAPGSVLATLGILKLLGVL